MREGKSLYYLVRLHYCLKKGHNCVIATRQPETVKNDFKRITRVELHLHEIEKDIYRTSTQEEKCKS